MDVDIKIYDDNGYKPVVDFNCWRVAFLNSDHTMKKDEITYIERHMLTDEIFVLLQGSATLMIGGKRKSPYKKINLLKMEKGKVYNVKKAVWHNVLMSKNCKILIVENKNTSKKNTEYFYV